MASGENSTKGGQLIPAVWGASRVSVLSLFSSTIRIPLPATLSSVDSQALLCAPTGCLIMFNTRVNPQTQNTHQVRGLEHPAMDLVHLRSFSLTQLILAAALCCARYCVLGDR